MNRKNEAAIICLRGTHSGEYYDYALHRYETG
jgi:hypothetical protein